MTGQINGFVLNSPGRLSSRAVAFLHAKASRTAFDPGIVGDRLRVAIRNVYGVSNEPIVKLLEGVQRRFGGLAYESGFFQAEVRFAPVCEPEDADEELEILYAVDTGSPAGASVKVSGEVEVGLDGMGIVEFSDLDGLVECDSMFDQARAFPVEYREVLSISQASHMAENLKSERAIDFRIVPEASGKHCQWFVSGAALILLSSTWAEMGSGIPPVMYIWGEKDATINHVKRLIARVS